MGIGLIELPDQEPGEGTTGRTSVMLTAVVWYEDTYLAEPEAGLSE